MFDNQGLGMGMEETKKPQPIQFYLEQLEMELENLSKIYSSLEENLVAVTLTKPSPDEEEKSVIANASPLAVRICNCEKRLKKLNNLLYDLSKRLNL